MVHYFGRDISKTCCFFQVDGSLTLNILSVSFAFMGIIIISVSLAGLHPASEQCKLSKDPRPTEYHYYHNSYDSDRNECFVAKSILMVSISKGFAEYFLFLVMEK